MKYSIIVPVYNRPDEVDELLDSLTRQAYSDFEVIIVEDGSSIPCKDVCEKYGNSLPLSYFLKENSGPGQSRNYGAERAKGDYLIIPIIESGTYSPWIPDREHLTATRHSAHHIATVEMG